MSADRRRVFVAAVIVLLALAAFAGYQQIFSTFADYDDEGYVMVSLASYMQGLPLYDDTYTQYGPAFFQIQTAFHTLTGLPLTHDVTRLRTLIVWLLAAALCGLTVHRMTASRGAALAAGLAVFFHLERLALEPGHPQELAVLAIGAILLLGSRLDRVARARAMYGGMGVVVGVILLTKLNVGVLLALPIGVTCLVLLADTRSGWSRVVRGLGLAAAVLFPLLLTARAWSSLGDAMLPLVVSLSLAAVVWRGLAVATPQLSWRDAGWMAAAGAATVVTSLGLALGQGTTLSGLAYGLVGQHQSLIETFFIPAPVPLVILVWAVPASLAALLAHRRPAVMPLVQLGLLGALLYAGLRYAVETPSPLIHGLNDRGGAAVLAGVAAPAVWVLLGAGPSARTPSRLWLCSIAAVQPLGAFPVPGTQMAVGTMALVTACVVAWHDGVWLHGDWLIRRRPAVATLLAVLIGVLLARDVQFPRQRAALTPLDLPGTSRLRLEPERVEDLRWIVRTLRERADTFIFGRHARNSVYFWTEQDPPTGLNATFWPYLLTPSEQRRVIRALEDPAAGRVAVVQTPFDVPLPDDSPLLQHIASRYEPAATRNQFEVWLTNR